MTRGGRIGVLYLNNLTHVGGAQITLRSIIARLDRTRFVPYLAVPAGQPDLTDFFRTADVSIVEVPLPRLNPPSFRAAYDIVRTAGVLAAVIRRQGIEIVHSNTQRGGPFGLALKAMTGARFIWTLNDVGLYRRVRIFTPFPDRLTCVSNTMYDSLRGWPRRHARVIYNGVEVERRTPERRAQVRRDLRESLGIPENALVIGNVARLDHWKGVHVLIEAMARVMIDRPAVWFVQIGDASPSMPEYADDLRRACLALPGGRGRMIGFRSDVQSWYDAFDVFAHAPIVTAGGHTESFGMSVAEAMGHGLPVVASAAGGLREVVADGETGFLVPPGDPAPLAAAIAQLLDDPSLRRRFGDASAARQAALFDQQREVAEFEDLYLELARESARPIGRTP